jgi:hypothetical protein
MSNFLFRWYVADLTIRQRAERIKAEEAKDDKKHQKQQPK